MRHRVRAPGAPAIRRGRPAPAEGGAAVAGSPGGPHRVSNEGIPRTNEVPENPVRFTRVEWEGRPGTWAFWGGWAAGANKHETRRHPL